MSNSTGDMPIVEHLIELRNRLIRMVLAVLVCFLALVAFANDIYTFIAAPLQSLMPEGTSMIATEVASPFLAPFKLTLWVCVAITMPYLLIQIWGFIAPGLYDSEKRLAVPLVVSSIFLFYAGLAFAYYVVFPLVFGFFTSISPDGVEVMTDINAYLSFVMRLFFVFGLAFEIPVAIFLLIRMGVVEPDSFASKRPYVFLSCFVLGMLVTPPDVISQTILALPMYLLFEVGLLLGRLMHKKKDELDEIEEEFGRQIKHDEIEP